MQEDEETVIEGIVVSESGSVPEHYLNRMRSRRDVVVMKDRTNITILQSGGMSSRYLAGFIRRLISYGECTDKG